MSAARGTGVDARRHGLSRQGKPCLDSVVDPFFTARRWTPFDFQRQAWAAYLRGESGLVHAPTGMGKSLSAWLGPVIEEMHEHQAGAQASSRRGGGGGGRQGSQGGGIRVLWITPLRALAGDTTRALREAADELVPHWTIELRSGDTSSHVKARQRRKLPSALVTTPESATILLSYPEAAESFAGLRCIVVDEWHELMGTKRGVQTELVLARLRALCPGVRTWGLSATLGNTAEAADTLTRSTGLWPVKSPTPSSAPEAPTLIRGIAPKRIEVETLIPDDVERYPFTGHLGTKLLDKVIERIERASTTLLFTNTRSQSEIWYRNILRARPDLIGAIGLHHGSLDRDIRRGVEALLRPDENGRARLRCVVCTSSLDLGVDFSPVDQVIQVGSPKGVARLIQRAGRSGHAPGQVSRILGVPTNAFELIEFAAARDAVEAALAEEGRLESRPPIEKPLDVLAQHLVTMAMGGGFEESAMQREVRSTRAFADLTDAEWTWAMDFVRQGGPALTAYPRFARIAPENGLWRIASRKAAVLHRIGIGTIVGDTALRVQYTSGRVLGSIEESFITRLTPGDRFVFAGRVLELIRVREMTAFVRRASSTKGAVPRWNGGKMALSSHLFDHVQHRLEEARAHTYRGEEMQAVRPLLERQLALSAIPQRGDLLIELFQERGRGGAPGEALAFLYPFAGRLVHEGLGPLLCLRLARRHGADGASIHNTSTDYGIELRSASSLDLTEDEWRELFTTDNLVDDLIAALDAAQLSRRHFREIARIAGLTHTGYPGSKIPMRHLQASSDMFYDVFRQFDPENLLLDQSRREVLEGQFEVRRLRDTLHRLGGATLIIQRPATLTPMAFPLWAETLRGSTVSTETWEKRVRTMVMRLEKEAARQERRSQRNGNTTTPPRIATAANGHSGRRRAARA